MTDDFLEALRHLDSAEYPGRGDRLDPALVVRAGRRRRAVVRGSAGAGATALVLAVGLGLPAALGSRTSAPPANPADGPVRQEPRAVWGDGPTAALEPGAVALHRPTTSADGRITVNDVAGYRVEVTTDDDALLVDVYDTTDLSGRTSSDVPDVVSVRLPRHPADDPTTITWSRPYDGVSGQAYSPESGEAAVLLLTGVLPPWQHDPTAYLYSGTGWTLDSGVTTHYAEVPTFRPPGDDVGLMYAVLLTGEAFARFSSSPSTVVFVGSDGEAFWPACDRWTSAARVVTGTCADMLGVTEDDLWVQAPAVFDWFLRSTPTPAVGNTPPADIAAPPVAELAPGIGASTGLIEAGQMEGDEGAVGVYYLAGNLDGASVRVGFGDEPTPWWTVFGVKDEVVSGALPGFPSDRAPFDADLPFAQTGFQDVHEGYFQASVVPAETDRAFVVSTTWFEMADGSHRHSFEVPLFGVPSPVASVVGADRQMYVLAWARPATDKLFDATSDVVFVQADGTIVDPGCAEGACDSEQLFADAYAEIRATLGG